MKKKWIFFVFTLVSIIEIQGYDHPISSKSELNDSCITVECFTAAPPTCSSENIDVCFDVLYWHASEGAGWAQRSDLTSVPGMQSFYNVSFGWDPGFRLGLGYAMEYDQWDTQLSFTWFRTTTENRATANSGDMLSQFVGSGLSLEPNYKFGMISWDISYNIFDWDLGKTFFVGNSLLLRPSIGVKGGWIQQNLNAFWENPTHPTIKLYLIANEDMKNDFWGVGPKIELQGKWIVKNYCKQSFSLFANFVQSLMWGHWSFEDLFQNNVPETIIVDVPGKDLGAVMFGGVIGLGWDVMIDDNTKHFGAQLGYELQDWVNQFQLFNFSEGANKKDLFLQGANLNLRFDF